MEFKTEKNKTTVFLYERITEFTARDFLQIVNNTKSTRLCVRINSPGGDVYSAQAIFTVIKTFPGQTEIYIDGVAASAASFVALAGQKVFMAKNAMLMIHNPNISFHGTAQQIRDAADLLDKIKGVMLSQYSEKTGKSIDELSAMCDKETWFTAEQALENKFIDGVIEDVIEMPTKVAAQIAAHSKTADDIFNLYKININNNQNEETMNLNKLISKLKLAKDADENAIFEAIDLMVAENDKLKGKADKTKEAEATAVQSVLNAAFNAKKITADLMPKFQALLESDFETTSEILNDMPGGSMVPYSKMLDLNGSGNVTGDIQTKPKAQWTLDDYRRFAPLDLQRNPKLYASLCEKAGIENEQ